MHEYKVCGEQIPIWPKFENNAGKCILGISSKVWLSNLTLLLQHFRFQYSFHISLPSSTAHILYFPGTIPSYCFCTAIHFVTSVPTLSWQTAVCASTCVSSTGQAVCNLQMRDGIWHVDWNGAPGLKYFLVRPTKTRLQIILNFWTRAKIFIKLLIKISQRKFSCLVYFYVCPFVLYGDGITVSRHLSVCLGTHANLASSLLNSAGHLTVPGHHLTAQI